MYVCVYICVYGDIGVCICICICVVCVYGDKGVHGMDGIVSVLVWWLCGMVLRMGYMHDKASAAMAL